MNINHLPQINTEDDYPPHRVCISEVKDITPELPQCSNLPHVQFNVRHT